MPLHNILSSQTKEMKYLIHGACTCCPNESFVDICAEVALSLAKIFIQFDLPEPTLRKIPLVDRKS